jgi:hypothetical protein
VTELTTKVVSCSWRPREVVELISLGVGCWVQELQSTAAAAETPRKPPR